MKKPHSILMGAIAALAFSSSLYSQSSTPVIGYYKQTFPEGASTICPAFVTKSEFQGLATSTAATSITRTGAGWTAGSLNSSATQTFYVEVLDGPWEGLIIDIVSNTADTLTLAENVGASGYNLAATVKFAVRKHATIGTLFPGGAGFTDADNLTQFLPDGSTKTFVAVGGSWFDLDGNPQDNSIIDPAEGLIVSVVGGPRTITVGGNSVSYVKTTPTRYKVTGNQVNIVGILNPLVPDNIAITATGFGNPSPIPALSLTDADSIQILDDTLNPVKQYFVIGGSYFDGDGNPAGAADTIKAGSAFVIGAAENKSFKQNVTHPIN